VLIRVVTMTVTHVNSFVDELELSGFDAVGRAVRETLCPTNVHKLFSATRNDWVMTQDLRVGEVLRTQSGLSTITGVKRKAGDQRVYNFEVEQTHAYFVGATRTLSHNTDCPVSGYLPDKSFKPAGYLPAPAEPAGYLPAPRERTWPKNPKEMNDMLGFEGTGIPDVPSTPGRNKVVWQPNANTKITFEQHPYHPGAPDWHKGPHWHIDTPGTKHARCTPGQPLGGS